MNETEISQYFPLEEVRKGAFYVANKLYGLTFEQLDNLPLPHPEALAFEVKDADGKHIGIYYADYFPRAGKSSGAWMDAFRPQSKLLNSSPVITNVCNFTKPAGDMPALLTFDEACTLFHEFGHAFTRTTIRMYLPQCGRHLGCPRFCRIAFPGDGKLGRRSRSFKNLYPPLANR